MSRLEKLTNIAVLLSCALLVAALGRNFYLSHTRPAAGTEAVARGQQITLPGYTPASTESTLIMVLSTQCHFCKDSMPFYRKLTVLHRSAPGRLRVVAVLPEPESEASAYLDRNGVGVDHVFSLPPGDIGVNATPTLLLLDPRNKVEESWVGLLGDSQQAEVLENLRKL